MTTPATADVPKRRAFRRVALLGGLLAALVLLEGGLRIWHGAKGTYAVTEEALRARSNSPWVASPDPELVYVHRPEMRAEGELKIESHGILRPTEVSPSRAPDSVRIAVVGDSVGAALNFRHDDRFPTRIERALGEALGTRVEVLNFCVNGYDTLQEARLLETVVAPLTPDAVVVAYCLNDPAESVVPIAWFREPSPPASYAFDFLWRGARDLIGRPVGRPLAPGAGPRGPSAPFWERMYDPDGKGWRTVLRGLDRIAAWSRERKVPVLVAVFPLLLPDDAAGETTRAFRTQVAEAARSRGLAVTDLQDVVAGAAAGSLAYAPDDVYHLSIRGHIQLAQRLLPDVRALVKR